MKKKVSVIIPCFNAAKWLPKCFLSLVGQTMGMESLELIFVNDASTDEGRTWEMLMEFEKAFPDSVVVIDLPDNRRQGGARNEGLKYAAGEYIAFVDADDWVLPDIYEKVYKKAKETDADIVQFGFNYYFDKMGIVDSRQPVMDELIQIDSPESRKKMLLSEKITYGCWNKLYRRVLVEEAGVQYAEHVVYEEPLFVYPLLYAADRFVIMPDKLYIYRQNNNGTMHSDMKVKETLLQHATVQFLVWEFMKKTRYFEPFYEEIKLYFLHTYLFETLDFAKARGMTLDYSMYEPLTRTALREVRDITCSPYASILVKQMPLYKAIAEGFDEEKYLNYISYI